jgi:hypothetical protein
MKLVLAAFLALALQEPAANGVAIERTVKRTSIDWLGRVQEIQRKELLLVRGGDLAIIDLTFGERLIIRSGSRKILRADPLAREYAEFTFDEAAALRKAGLDQIRAAKARVPGTDDEKELEAILLGFDQFAAEPMVELKVSGAQREVIVNGDRVRVSVQVDDKVRAPGWMDALSATGAFHPAVAGKLKELGGLPSKGTLRYAMFLDRIIEQFEVTSARPREIPDADFELPKGLIRAPLKGFEKPASRVFSKPPALKQSFKEDDGDKPSPDSGEKKDKK